jgi:hypothetical protein
MVCPSIGATPIESGFWRAVEMLLDKAQKDYG